MSWEMQVLIDGEWKSVRPTGAKDPYRFPDERQALYMLSICYPDQVREERLGGPMTTCALEVDESPNIDYPAPAGFGRQIPHRYTPEEQARLDKLLEGAIESDPGEEGEGDLR